jgi:magnesium chelatase subunit H
MQKHISAADLVAGRAPVRVVIVTLDSHLDGAIERARPSLERDIPGFEIDLHAATEWARDGDALTRCRADIARADFIITTMLFMEDHIKPVIADLEARRASCDAVLCGMSAGEVIRLTRLGGFTMTGSDKGVLSLLKRLRGSSKGPSSGAQQMAVLRRIPKILRFIPGTAQDVRAYFLGLQYLLAGSEENIEALVRFLIDRYAAGPRQYLRGTLGPRPPVEYPDVGVYHPKLERRVDTRLDTLPAPAGMCKGTVGLLIMRSYVVAGNCAHYDGVVAALESRGLRCIPAFATGLDARPAIEQFFLKDGHATVDAVVSLTGFSLVGGPAYNDAKGAEDILARLDVPYVAAHALEFESIEQWQACDRGLMPVETTMMVAIPEIDGATGPIVFGGRSENAVNARDMHVHRERADMLASRVEKLVALKTSSRADRRLAIVLFNFPPNAGATGTAAFLSVYESLFNTLKSLKSSGYSVDVPVSVDALRSSILEGNASRYGAGANVAARVSADDHVRRERWLNEIEAQWGPAPGKIQADGRSIFVLGAQFGNVFVGVQPGFGYEGDPMRLLFERGFAPTHAFSAFYRWLREDFGAHAVLHFGTHGALEFMPGKQVGLSSACWPDRLIGDLPNFYLYAANNPSEGTIAKRRAAATLISYLTPPVGHAGLYKGLLELKSTVERWRGLAPSDACDRPALASAIQAQAAELNLAAAEPVWSEDETAAHVSALQAAMLELEYELIPQGMHVVGQPASEAERAETVGLISESELGTRLNAPSLEALIKGEPLKRVLELSGLAKTSESVLALENLANTSRLLGEDHELAALVNALDGRFVRPAPSGDLLRTPAILPTGRNIHGFDPFRMPSAFAMADGARQSAKLLARHLDETGALPESIAVVLWGTDNIKSEGGPIAQALFLLGAEPRFDSYGRLTGASLVPLAKLGRPRIDVVMTLSGIFRDLLPLQCKLLAEAALLAAEADEPVEMNYVRKHALAFIAQHGGDLETAALRVFSNAEGAYGSNVNQIVDGARWTDEDELAEVYTRRKCFAYGRDGKSRQNATLLNAMLSNVDLAYQNLESVELGVTTVDHYFDTLGGISRSIRRARGAEIPVYIGDQTRGEGKVRTLAEQVAIETRTRVLNPKWYESMLRHGYEGVRQIEAHVTNTVGWSATTGQVAPWVYQSLTQTFVIDDEMRRRLAELNPVASAKVANRLLEAHERNYWTPDAETLAALRKAGEELEDRVEGIGGMEVAA